MSEVRSHGDSNKEAFEVSGCYVQSPDDIVMYVRRVRELTPPLSLAIVDYILARDWARVMS